MGDIMFSLHMKATMMKVSDPIIFGHCVKEFYKDVFEKHGATFEKLGVNMGNGLGDVFSKIASLPEAEKKAIEDDIEKQYETRPRIAMVNAGKKITNLHVPSDVIIDNSVPTAIRWGGQMQGPSGKDEDIKAVIPEGCSHQGLGEVGCDSCEGLQPLQGDLLVGCRAGARQGAPRLLDRLVAHPGVGHERQDAVHRAHACRWRYVRDRCRRLCSEAR